MNDHSSEYLGGRNGSANGNGNGHDAKFGIVAKEDPMLSIVVPSARKRVAVNHKLSFGARNFFQWLTDQSLTPGGNVRKGVLQISDYDAGVRFRVHGKTIRNWKRELEPTGEVWITERWMKNSFPKTVYNITAIVGQATLPLNSESNDGSLVEDSIFSSNRRRNQAAKRSTASGKFVCRLHGVSGCALCRRTPPGVRQPGAPGENLQNQAETATVGKILPSTAATDCRPPRQNGAANRGKTVP